MHTLSELQLSEMRRAAKLECLRELLENTSKPIMTIEIQRRIRELEKEGGA